MEDKWVDIPYKQAHCSFHFTTKGPWYIQVTCRKSAPRPPNISDEHVSCTAPATENASLQILFTCPTPAIAFGNVINPSRFAHFWQGAQSLAPAMRNGIWTSKSSPYPLVFLHFWRGNVLRATMACTFLTCQIPKVVQQWCVLCILTSKCASCHSGVHFFDISTSKSGPNMRCFLHFLTSKCASRHNGVQFFISRLARWLRARRFSEPTFRPSGATNHWKNAVFRDFSTFSRTCTFFLLTLSLLWSSLFFSSLLWLFPPLLFHLSILSEVWLLNFLRTSCK